MKFSVLICVYEKDVVNYFIEAYESIFNQTLLPNQITLVIDGPIPNNLKKSIDNFIMIATEKNIEFNDIWLETNKGHGIARKTGVIICKYETIALADADDINHHQRFEKQLNFLRMNEEISIVGSQILEIESKTKSPIGERQVPLENHEIIKYLKTRCPFNQMTVMFRKSDVILSGNYVDFFHNEDYFLWARMYLKGLKFANLPDVLVSARVNKDFYNRRGGQKYFMSELRMQNFLLSNNIIYFPRWFLNITLRITIQIIIPPSIRGHIFKIFFRSNK